MIAIDTNVLVRVVVEDVDQLHQTRIARKIVERALHVFVPQLVQVETVWVLESCYKFKKEQIIFFLKTVVENSAFILQHEQTFRSALKLFEKSSADFSDCLILAECEAAGYAVITFDKKFAKIEGVQLATTEVSSR